MMIFHTYVSLAEGASWFQNLSGMTRYDSQSMISKDMFNFMEMGTRQRHTYGCFMGNQLFAHYVLDELSTCKNISTFYPKQH